MIDSISELKHLFSSNLKNFINDLELIINASSNEKESKPVIKNKHGKEESPAATLSMLVWPNGEKVWTHNKNLKKNSFTINYILPPTFSIPVRINKAKCIGAIYLMISITELNTYETFFGDDRGKGRWGISGNASVFADGKWSRGKTYQVGDIITISGNNGFISYQINDDDNSSYQYNMNTTTLYFGISANEGDILELVL